MNRSGYIFPLIAVAFFFLRKRRDDRVGAIRRDHLIDYGNHGNACDFIDLDFERWAKFHWHSPKGHNPTSFYEIQVLPEVLEKFSVYFNQPITKILVTDLSVSHSFIHSKEKGNQRLTLREFLSLPYLINNWDLYFNENSPAGKGSVFVGIPVKVKNYHGHRRPYIFALFRFVGHGVLEHWTTFIDFV